MAKERNARKQDETKPDRDLYEIWWQYLIQTEAFMWLRQYAIVERGFKERFWQEYMEPFKDFVEGYDGRRWFTHSFTYPSGAFEISEDFQQTWVNWESGKEYLAAVDGPLGENIIESWLQEAATAPLGRIEAIERRLKYPLSPGEKSRVAFKVANKLHQELRNRVVLCIDPFSGTVNEIVDVVKKKIEAIRSETLVGSISSPFSHLPEGGEGCRFRFPTPGRRPDQDVLKRRLTLYILANRFCLRAKSAQDDDLDNSRVCYEDLLTGRFHDFEGLPYGYMDFLPFGQGPFTANKTEKELWRNWRERKKSGDWRRRGSRLRGEDERAKVFLQEELAAARETLRNVQQGWFPAPPND